MKKMMFLLCMAVSIVMQIAAQTDPLWLRYPSISPDGKTIVFSYKGDIYKVPSSGGDAIPLTLHESYDYMPVWSHDGKWLAFASDRYGNFDVFIMPSSGGEAKRLTYHSANDYPYDFTPDNKKVLFGTNRNDIYTSVRFPQRALFQKLYEVPVDGGRSVMVLSAGSEFAKFNAKGDKILFQDRKGFEDPYRKHHTSAVTRDIWIYDIKKDEYMQVSAFDGEDRDPVWGGDDNTFYYLSEKGGTQNIYKATIGGQGSMSQVTKMKDNPVRFLTRSNDGVLCFTNDGQIYTMKDGGSAQKINITINADIRGKDDKILPINTGITQTALSPNGKEIALWCEEKFLLPLLKVELQSVLLTQHNRKEQLNFLPMVVHFIMQVKEERAGIFTGLILIAKKNHTSMHQPL
jgi:Tol biopolymer transport system component